MKLEKICRASNTVWQSILKGCFGSGAFEKRALKINPESTD